LIITNSHKPGCMFECFSQSIAHAKQIQRPTNMNINY